MNLSAPEIASKRLERDLRQLGFPRLSLVPISILGNLGNTRPGVKHILIVGENPSERDLQLLGMKYGVLRLNNPSLGQAEIFTEREADILQDIWIRSGGLLNALATLRFGNKSVDHQSFSRFIGNFLRTNFSMEKMPGLRFRWYSEFLGWELCAESEKGRMNQLVLADKERTLLAALNPEWDNPPEQFSEVIFELRKEPSVRRAYGAILSYELMVSRSLRRNHPEPEPSLRSDWIRRLELQAFEYGNH